MNTKTAVSRAKDFLDNHIGYMYDWDGDHSTNGEYDFSYSNQPFYVYLDVQNHGHFTSDGGFYTEVELNKLISLQLSCSFEETYHRWDNVIIFDIEKNKVVVPKIGL